MSHFECDLRQQIIDFHEVWCFTRDELGVTDSLDDGDGETRGIGIGIHDLVVVGLSHTSDPSQTIQLSSDCSDWD